LLFDKPWTLAGDLLCAPKMGLFSLIFRFFDFNFGSFWLFLLAKLP
jgi:hypothetical protein